MITQERYWRKYLNKIAKKLERRYRQKRWNSISLFNLEKEIFIGFYSIRKLIESKKVSKPINGLNYKITTYPHSAKTTLMKNPNHPLNNYNLLKGFDSNKSIKDICNQFIHSEIFIPFIPFKRELVGIYVCSDDYKESEIYYIQLITVAELFLSVSLDKIKRLNLKIKGTTISTNLNAI